MTTQAELLDKVRELCSIPSDNALALRASVSRQIVSEWRNGGKNMGDDRIAQLCALAKLDGAEWVARIHADRATDATERKVWLSMLDRLRPIAAAVGLVAVGMASSGDVLASAKPLNYGANSPVMPIM
jgi:transcriptional regulator with XRE-family HTH domain